jgi:hypothetical protein
VQESVDAASSSGLFTRFHVAQFWLGERGARGGGDMKGRDIVHKGLIYKKEIYKNKCIHSMFVYTYTRTYRAEGRREKRGRDEKNWE